MRRISTSDLIYARVLLDCNPPFEKAREMHRICQLETKLTDILEDPTVDIEAKYRIIEKIFDKSVVPFMKLTVKNGKINEIRAIYNVYKEMYFRQKNIKLAYVTEARELNSEQLDKIKKFVCKKFNTDKVELEIHEDKSLIGGFILKVDDFEFDRSISGALKQLKQNLVR